MQGRAQSFTGTGGLDIFFGKKEMTQNIFFSVHFQNFSKYFIASDCKFAGCPKCIFTSAPQLDLSWRADAHDGNCNFCSYDPILLHRSWQTNFLPRKPVVCNHPMSSTRLCHSFPTENWYHNIPSAPPQRPFVQMRACAPQFEQANNKPGKFLSIHLCTRTRWEFTSFVIFPKAAWHPHLRFQTVAEPVLTHVSWAVIVWIIGGFFSPLHSHKCHH